MTCVSEPISWLRLERFAAGELADAAIGRHLEACPACRSCLERITGDARPLPPLVLPARAPRRPWFRFAWAGGLAAAIAAIVLWIVIPGNAEEVAGPRVRVKGGVELVVSLVRHPDDARYKVRVTCSAPVEVTAEVVVHDVDGASFPLPPQRIRCGNEVTLDGAFRLTAGDATVCVEVDGERACVQVDSSRRR